MSGPSSIEFEYANSKTVDLGDVRLSVLSLERILLSKRTANREKDRIAVAQIEQTLKVLGALNEEE